MFVVALPIAYTARPVREAKSDPLPSQNTSTLDDQTDLALTVYNSRSRARSRCAERAAAVRQLRLELHGHCGDG
jgi:hypothetical protein